ncbi:hypothetical protein JCM8097_004731 [Rhodosporidiobolus ruineniae]
MPPASARGVHVDGECEFCGKLETFKHYLYTAPSTHSSAGLPLRPAHPLLPASRRSLSSAAFLPPLLTFFTSTARFPSLHHHDTSATPTTSTTTRQAPPLQRNQPQHRHQDGNNRNAATSARSADAGA